ncbi:hypothetical protein E2320_000311 [Naja naja]|nr:hypothetical protein E2320_000311 [Naja naja]
MQRGDKKEEILWFNFSFDWIFPFRMSYNGYLEEGKKWKELLKLKTSCVMSNILFSSCCMKCVGPCTFWN